MAKLVMNFFENENVTVMNWPALRSDLNPIENMWKTKRTF